MTPREPQVPCPDNWAPCSPTASPVPADRPSACGTHGQRGLPSVGWGHRALLVWSSTPWALGRVRPPLAHPVLSPRLHGLCPLQMPALTGLGLATTGTGSGTGMARGLGTVRLNFLGSVTLAFVFEGGG